MDAKIPNKRMDNDRFISMRDAINALCKKIPTSGSNGRLPLLLAAIENLFVEKNMSQEDYWIEVCFRAGKGGVLNN
jgi:hypothetical protein